MTSRAAFRRAIERHDLDELLALFRDLIVMVRPRSGMERLLAEVQPRLMAAIQADAAG